MGKFLENLGGSISEFGNWVAGKGKDKKKPSDTPRPEKPKQNLMETVLSETKRSFAQFNGKELDEETVAALTNLLDAAARKSSTATLQEVHDLQLTQVSQEVARVTCGGEKVIFGLSFANVNGRTMIEPIVWRKNNV
jgi:hypothetical protein